MTDSVRMTAVIGAILMSLVVVGGGAGLTFLLFFKEIPAKNEATALGLIGGFSTLLGVVVKFWLDWAVRMFFPQQVTQTTTQTPTTATTTTTGTP
jgi:hypothetical protein